MIPLLGVRPVQVLRYAAAATGSDGRAIWPAPSSSTVSASVQPSPGRDLERLPEGVRLRESVTLYTAALLRTADDDAGVPADVVVVDGVAYEVAVVRAWQSPILLGHWHVVAVRLPDPPPVPDDGEEGGP